MHRVILWGPGQMGIGALRAVIQHPGLELVGLVVHSEAKEGRDAGDLCGLPPTGIIATRDIDAALRSTPTQSRTSRAATTGTARRPTTSPGASAPGRTW